MSTMQLQLTQFHRVLFSVSLSVPLSFNIILAPYVIQTSCPDKLSPPGWVLQALSQQPSCWVQPIGQRWDTAGQEDDGRSCGFSYSLSVFSGVSAWGYTLFPPPPHPHMLILMNAECSKFRQVILNLCPSSLGLVMASFCC